jgi:hypothetical protein
MKTGRVTGNKLPRGASGPAGDFTWRRNALFYDQPSRFQGWWLLSNCRLAYSNITNILPIEETIIIFLICIHKL